MRIASRRRAPARLREQRAAYRTGLPGPLYCDTKVVEGRDDLLVSDLAVTEIVAAVGRRLRQGTLTREAAPPSARHPWPNRRGHLPPVELTRDVHRRAEHVLLAPPGAPLRAADALHLALATSARAASLATFDARLAVAARASGLVVYPAAGAT